MISQFHLQVFFCYLVFQINQSNKFRYKVKYDNSNLHSDNKIIFKD